VGILRAGYELHNICTKMSTVSGADSRHRVKTGSIFGLSVMGVEGKDKVTRRIHSLAPTSISDINLV
jgi:hypothetical protein